MSELGVTDGETLSRMKKLEQEITRLEQKMDDFGFDIIMADFEQSNYGAWTVTGTAFGPGPA